MKHQYFGDINDYRKYGLLRLLAKEGGLRLGICWMLTPEDGRPDGGKISYLAAPEHWRALDPDLFDHLAAALQCGSTSGNLSIVAGGHAQVSGSDLLAGLNLDLIARSVTIDPGLDQSQTHQSQDIKQSGLTVALSAPVLSAAQTVTTMATTAAQSKDRRVQALAAATAGLAAYNGARALASSASTGGGVSVSATYGSSQSHSESSETSSTLSGSQVRAGGDLTIVATGGGTASDLTVIGSSLAAGHNLTLAADHAILLESGQNTDTSSSQSSSSGWGVGVAASYGSQGVAVGFTANASKSRGTGNGSDLSNVDTTVTAGNLLSLSSGGDTSLLGAVLSGQQVVAAVGGDLTLASRQDTSTYHSDNQSLGGSLTVGAGVAGSVNYSKEKIASNYASVTEQTGIHAGDGGFQISVQGNTGLQGAVITSSDAAVANNKNTLSTGILTVSDIQNHSDYNATSLGLGLGGSIGNSGKTASGEASATGSTPVNQGSVNTAPIAMRASGDASSTTLSGISGGALTIGNGARQQALTGQTVEAAVAGVNRAVSTGKDSTNGVANTFNLDDIETGFAVTRAFGQEVGTFVAAKAANADRIKEALKQERLDPGADPALVEQLKTELGEAATWVSGGTSRQVMTALAAAASGNVTGSGLQMVQGALVNFVQQKGAALVGDLMHGSTDEAGNFNEGVLQNRRPFRPSSLQVDPWPWARTL